MRNLLLLVCVLTSQFAFASDPMWSCHDNGNRYEIDWNEAELNFHDIAYVYTDNKKIKAKVIGMSMWSPDIVFYDFNRNIEVVLLLDTSGQNGFYKMYEYGNGSQGELVSDRVKCEFNY
jgi:hypothetical protein